MAGTALRLFNVAGEERGQSPSQTHKKAYIPYVNGSNRWGVLHATTASWPLALSNLVLLASDPECEDQVLTRFRDHLVPSWSYASWTIPYFAWHYQNLVEYGPQGGVPGLCAFVSARHAWLSEQIRAGVAAGATQIVLLRTGYDSRPFTMRFPHTKFFVVDEPETLRAQRAMLDEVLPNRNLHPRPAYVNVSWGNLATLIPALTAAGFDPGSRAVFVAEGLLPHLDQESVETLLSDISALASPGSTMAFDFLHEDVLEGRVTPAGYANLALAVANKGEPFLSGMRPVYSALVRLFQGHSMRVGALMAPADLAAWRACAAKGIKGTAPQGDQGQSRCSLVSGLANGMPRYLSLASVTKAGARPGLRDAPQAISMDGAGGCDRSGRPDTSAGGPNCFVASLFTLLCGAKQGPAKIGAAAPAPKDKSVGKQVSGPLSVRGKEPPVSPARRCSGASSSSCDPAGGSRSDSPVQEQSSEWMLRTDTERAVFDGCALPTDMASSTDNGSESGTETITLPPAIGLDRAQSILPQSSGSSLTSHAALAAAAAAIAEEASEDTDPCSSGSYAPASPVHQAAEAPLPGSAQEGTMSVKDLKKLFSSLPQ